MIDIINYDYDKWRTLNLLGVEPVSLMIKKTSFGWFGRVEQKDDNDWVKHCTIGKLKELD